MAEVLINRRRQERILSTTGMVPTVPTVADHTLPGWLETDIYEGEICFNNKDDKFWTRCENRIIGPFLTQADIQAAIEYIDQQIAAEATARSQGDASLSTQISLVNNGLSQDINNLQSLLSAEIVNIDEAYQLADDALDDKIDNLEIDLQQEIEDAISSYRSADTEINNQISALQSELSQEDDNLQNEIDSINADIATETQNRIDGDADLSTDIAASLVAAKAYADGLVGGQLQDVGDYDPTATGAFPVTGGSGAGGAIKKGNQFRISVAGTINGEAYDVNDCIRALINNPGQSVSNWGYSEHNTQQATESTRGNAKISTTAIVQNEFTTNDTDVVTPYKFWFGLARVVAMAWTWTAKQIFSVAPRFSSVTANHVLTVDSNKDLSSEAKQTGFNLALGTTAGTIAQGNDSRFTDERTPLDSSVTTNKIGAGAVTSAKIASDAVTTSKILDQNVTQAKIADSAINAGKLASDAVTTVKILDANVTTPKVANDAITNDKLSNMAAYTVKGNNTAASADPVDMTMDQFKVIFGKALQYTTADKTTTATAMADVDATNMNFALDANSVYEFEIIGILKCNGTGGSNVGLSVPSGANVFGRIDTDTTTVTSSRRTILKGGVVSSSTFGAGVQDVDLDFEFKATVITGVTAGNLRLQFKSATSGQTTTIYAGTFLRISKK